MPPDQRAATQEMIARFTPPERQRLLAHMRSLPPQERQALHARLLAMGVDERLAFIETLPTAEVQPVR